MIDEVGTRLAERRVRPYGFPPCQMDVMDVLAEGEYR